jgi:quercetin dioxygenase-like cupin family protein
VETWNLREIEVEGGSRSPLVLYSQEQAARVVLIVLEPGQELGDHQVKEVAFVLVVDGQAQIEDSGGQSVGAGTGSLVRFDPDERHAVSSASGARILLFLTPWPGAGHYRGSDARG